MTITITESELNALTWAHVDSECTDYSVSAAEYFDDPEIGEIESTPAVSAACGWTQMQAVTAAGDTLDVTIVWQTNGDTDGSYTDLYKFDLPDVGADGTQWETDFVVLDADGDRMNETDTYSAVSDAAESRDWQQHAAATLPHPPAPDDIDTDEDNDMDTITLTRDDDRDVRFSGDEIASVSSWEHSGPRNQRWTNLSLYRTASGKLVCDEVGKSLWRGEHDRNQVHIADTEGQLIESVGTGWLAKDLYDEAGIDHAEEI